MPFFRALSPSAFRWLWPLWVGICGYHLRWRHAAPMPHLIGSLACFQNCMGQVSRVEFVLLKRGLLSVSRFSSQLGGVSWWKCFHPPKWPETPSSRALDPGDGALEPEDPAPTTDHAFVHMFFYVVALSITIVEMNLFIGNAAPCLSGCRVPFLDHQVDLLWREPGIVILI